MIINILLHLIRIRVIGHIVFLIHVCNFISASQDVPSSINQHYILFRLIQPVPTWFDFEYALASREISKQGSSHQPQIELLDPHPDLPQGNSYLLEYIRDDEGFIREVRLLNSSRNIEGSIRLERSGPQILQLSVIDNQGAVDSTHLLSYDDSGRVVFHKQDTKSNRPSIESRIAYDIDGQTVCVEESSGRTLHFTERSDNVYIARTTTKEGFSIRSLWKTNNDGDIIWEATDDGTTNIPDSLDGVSQRTWKRINKTGHSTSKNPSQNTSLKTEILEGYVDLSTGHEQLVRRLLVTNENQEPVIRAYNRYGTMMTDLRMGDLYSKKEASTNEPSNKYFDGLGRIESIHSLSGHGTDTSAKKITYDTYGRLHEIKSSSTRGTSLEFSSFGDVEKITHPDGSSLSFSYNIDGLPEIYKKGKEEMASCTYDSLGRIQQSILKEDSGKESSFHFTYDSLHKLKAVSSEKTLTWTYDSFGRIESIREERPTDATQWTFEYDDLDRVIKLSTSGKQVFTKEYSYDLKGRKRTERVTDGNNKVVETLWKWKEDRTCLLTMRSEDTSYQYLIDETGRILTASSYTKSGNQQVKYSYEELAVGYKQVAKSKRGVVRERLYSKNHDILSERIYNPKGDLIQEQFWSDRDSKNSGSLTERAFENGKLIGSRKTRWKFGDNLRLECVETGAEDGSLRSTKYSYDNAGNLIKKTLPDGVEIIYGYNDSHQLIRISSSDQSIEYIFNYDGAGRITRIDDALEGISVHRTFDAAGNLIEDGEGACTVRAEYGTQSQLEALLLPDNVSIAFRSNTIECSYKGSILLHEKMSSQDPFSSVHRQIGDPNLDPLLLPEVWKDTEEQTLYRFDSLGQLIEHTSKKSLTEKQRFCALGHLLEREGKPVLRDDEGRPVGCENEKYSYDTRGNLNKIRIDETQYVLAYDALDRIIEIKSEKGQEEKYRYDAFNRKRFIEKKEGSRTVIQTIAWFGFEEVGSYIEGKLFDLKIATYGQGGVIKTFGVITPSGFYRTRTDAQGSIISYDGETSSSLSFGSFGSLKHCSPIPWGFMGKRKIDILPGWDFGARLYLPSIRAWTTSDPLGLSQGTNTHAFLSNSPIGKIELFGLAGWPSDFNEIVDHFWKGIETVFWKSVQSITFAQKQLDWFYEFRSHFEDLAFRIVSRSYLKLIGYNPEYTRAGTYGSRELIPKVRITQINGILNDFDDIGAHADAISEMHGGVPTHYVYSATDGFTGDLLRSLFSKVGFISRQAQFLVLTWRRLIEEMGGTSGGGLIVHYAHSLGGTDTQVALSQMKPEEKKMIRVLTFGSPTLVADSECLSVMNYVSVKDGVPLLSGLEYLKAILGWRNDVCFVESQSILPLIDHLFSGETYRRIVEDLGRKFQEEHLRREEPK